MWKYFFHLASPHCPHDQCIKRGSFPHWTTGMNHWPAGFRLKHAIIWTHCTYHILSIMHVIYLLCWTQCPAVSQSLEIHSSLKSHFWVFFLLFNLLNKETSCFYDPTWETMSGMLSVFVAVGLFMLWLANFYFRFKKCNFFFLNQCLDLKPLIFFDITNVTVCDRAS